MAESFANLKLSVAVNEGTRVVIVGKTGSGKSTLGNILLQKEHVYAEDQRQESDGVPDGSENEDQGQEADDVPDSSETGFVVASGFDSETKTCDYKMTDNAWGRNMKVLDTPGLFDTTEDPGKTLAELTNVVVMSSPGPHAILFVTRCDIKFTAEENEAFNMIIDTFKEKVKDFLVLVFTHGEAIKRTTIEQKLKTAPESLKKVLEIVGANYAVISQTEDESKRRQEVETLLSKIDWVSKNGELYYENDDLKNSTEILTKEIEKIMKERNVNWREAEFLVKKGLAMEKEQRWKDVKKKLLIAVAVTPFFAALIGLTGGLAAFGIAASLAEILVAGSAAGGGALIFSNVAELMVYLKEKKRATGKGKCVIA